MVEQAQEVARKGGKEIVLTGVNIGDFGKSTDETFIDLIRALDEVDGIVRYRISSIEPNLITDEAIDFVAHSKRFAPHFHIPLQSGSDAVLQLMRRRYDTALFRHKIEKIKEVMRHASNHLTPITLELGGKSPCIVHKSADIRLAAKRIVFGKFLNCGQTCVAPDYIYCDRTVKDKLIKELKKQIQKQYSKQPLAHKEYGKIINLKHFDRLLGLIDYDKVV